MRKAAALLLAATAMASAASAEPAGPAPDLPRAIAADDLSGAKAGLATGANPNAVFGYGESALARAVETQDAALVDLLLSHGAKPDTKDSEGFTPLILACERGNVEIVSALLDAKANVNTPMPDGTTPLAICARFSKTETVSRMLAMGAKPGSADARGQTPLMWAASTGNVETMALLLKADAQIDRTTEAGFTPLFFAIKSGVPEAAQLLLDAGADTAHRGPENTSALQLALYQKNWKAAAMLIERGAADLAERDRNGNQPLHAAAAGGDSELVALLLAKGADANGLTGPSRITWVTEANLGVPPPPVPPTPPLLTAAEHGRTDVMKLLADAGADKAFVAENGTNVVLAAAHSHSPASLERALSLAPDANVADAQGNTPLHVLLMGGFHSDLQAMFRVLADHGARTDIPNKKDMTAAQFAEKGLTTVREAYQHAFADTPSPMVAVSHD
ncbi:ankyrin repeat domain-containing protein [Novosphingobium malaysiense]|uniref:Ankyrin n=1 Tax=Novosphingobium malaysiense TaxID=1348853 RepID=A0A0B1ZQ77_9SPHN|nr:ankyrin repeat domain-containing protein [Novosphingobium malaysiense]KHK93280.1 ankyrin [Novosphingobium malaysiense]